MRLRDLRPRNQADGSATLSLHVATVHHGRTLPALGCRFCLEHRCAN
jgi:hypothetical protein